MSVSTKAVTVRVRIDHLKKVMRSRKPSSQSAVINALLAEEAERLRALAAIVKSAGSLTADDFDDRLL
jgi:hypothetical protein